MERSALRAKKRPWLFEKLEKCSTRLLSIVALHVLYALTTIYIDTLAYAGKVALFAFLSAMTLWVATGLPAGFVAAGLIIFVVLVKASEPELLYYSLSEEVVWLMIGSFIVGEAVKESGLAERLGLSLTGSRHSIINRFASLLLLSAFFIPSTSGRAALSIPLVKQLSPLFSREEGRALAIIAPIVILMSTSATLIGAGSHLIGISLLEKTAGETISFVQWLVWSVPFTIVITFFSLWIVKWQLWPKQNKSRNKGEIKSLDLGPLTLKEKKTAWLIAGLIAAWMTESIHGYDLGFVTITGALLLALPKYGILTWKQAVASVSWSLILFVASAAALGTLLVDSGVVEWMERGVMSILHLLTALPEWFIVIVILLVTTTSHLYITSHTTRAIVFVPSLLLFAEAIGANAAGVVFLSLIGMNYCVTFPVSSKALLLFYEETSVTYEAKDLVKVSFFLLPLYVAVMLLFYFAYWRWTGLAI